MRKGRLKGNMQNANRPPLRGAPSDICTTPYKPSPFNSKILISGIVIDGMAISKYNHGFVHASWGACVFLI